MGNTPEPQKAKGETADSQRTTSSTFTDTTEENQVGEEIQNEVGLEQELEEPGSNLAPSRGPSRADGFEQVVWDAATGHVHFAAFKILSQLGEGGFSLVWKMRMDVSQVPGEAIVAVKCPTHNLAFRPDLKELDMLLNLSHHPNMVILKYYFRRRQIIHLVLEFCAGGDLFSYIHRDKDKKDLGECAELFAYQIFRALAHCHSKFVVHRDVKPENLLVNLETGQVKLTDFGCATYMVHPFKEQHINYVGTRDFRAPELIFGATSYTNKIDVWGAAMVLTEILLGMPVFYCDAQSSQQLGERIIDCLGPPTADDCDAMQIGTLDQERASPRDFLRKKFAEHPASLNDLLSQSLVYNPRHRLSAWEMCQHPYFHVLYDRRFSLPNGHKPKYLFNFTDHEVRTMPVAVKKNFMYLRNNVL